MKALGLFKWYSKNGTDRFWITFLTPFGKVVETELTGFEWKQLALELKELHVEGKVEKIEEGVTQTYYSMVEP